MRTDLNLAKDPFRNRSLFWLGLTAAYLVAFMALVVVVARAAHVGADTEALRDKRAEQLKTIEQLESRVGEISDVQAHTVFSEGDRRALDDARELLTERAFSWSRLLSDLEPNVPAGAKLSGIEIAETETETAGAERVIVLRIQGRAKDFGQLSQFIANLDRTGGRFRAEPLENGLAGEGSEFEFSLEARYRPNVGTAVPAAPATEGKGDA
jgi:Tfp pilus assembly protein PilN